MSDKLVRINELPPYIDGLKEKLREMNYSERTIMCVARILQRFCAFAKKADCEFYDSFAMQKFSVAYNGDNYDNKSYSYKINRPLIMLNDFIYFNTVTRQKYWTVCDFKEGYAEYFSPFMEYLISRNYANGSIKCCRSHLLRFQNYLIDNGISDFTLISHEVVRKYCDLLADYSTTTICQKCCSSNSSYT